MYSVHPVNLTGILGNSQFIGSQDNFETASIQVQDLSNWSLPLLRKEKLCLLPITRYGLNEIIIVMRNY